MSSVDTFKPNAGWPLFDELEIGHSILAPPRELTASDVESFATLTGDHHPLHLDDAWAATTPFGRRIAHGLLVLSCAVGSLELDPERVLVLRRIDDVVFKRPVYIGDSISPEIKVRDLRPVDDQVGLVGLRLRVATEGATALVASFQALWRRASDLRSPR